MTKNTTDTPSAPGWMVWVLRAAAIYNIAWGLFILALPNALWDWMKIDRPNHEFLWTGLGTLILLFGVGYAIASTDPRRHWGLIAIGLASKVFAFGGTIFGAFIQKNVPAQFAWTGIVNDLVWWVPFGLILWWVRRMSVGSKSNPPA
ncbi:MAG: alkyl hydroperoxide reductase [Planctomycetes bacterium]|nr:alkyl hydroperoxide reductase [Planctomycetota bacterium]